MSDRQEESVESSQEEEEPSKNFLDDLKGDDPKIWGYDYYTIIYGSAGLLSLIMLFLYNVIQEPELKQMIMIQGLLSSGLLLAAMYFRGRL